MQKRLVFMELGDYSNDGHGKTSTIALLISGEDVSNERMKQAKQEAVAFTGVNIDEMVSEHKDSSIRFKDLTKLLECGFITLDEEEKKAAGEPYIFIDEDDYDELVKSGQIKDGDSDEISPTHLLMKFLGYGIPCFSYEILNTDQDDYIVGRGWDGSEKKPISSFGYGMFYG